VFKCIDHFFSWKEFLQGAKILGIKILVSIIGKDETAENYVNLMEDNKLTEEDLERFDHSLLSSIGITEA
jgi:hypothetical protein